MSDSPKFDLSNVVIPKSVDQAIENITNKPTKEVGDIFNDLLYLVFGGIHFNAEKRRMKYKYSLEEYEKSCKEKIKAIPFKDRVVEPNSQIICQALEDSKYCVEDENLREMFANLISSTIDSKVSKAVHPSFSSILKQMTSNDAKFLKIFIYKPEIPVCNFRLIDNLTSAFDILIEYAYLDSANESIEQVQSKSLILSSLERLGVIQILLDSAISDEKCYSLYENSKILKELQNLCGTDGKSVGFYGGLARLTVLGRHLLAVCCPNEFPIKKYIFNNY